MSNIQRLNYFNTEFLVDTDFNDEQFYHRDMRSRHNRTLHTWGVTDDNDKLQVTGSGKAIGVGAGMAIDKTGKELILLEPQTLDLSTFPANADVYVTIKYQQFAGDGIEPQNKRWIESPGLQALPNPPGDDSVSLAKVHLDGNGSIASIDQSIRPISGAKINPASSLQVGGLTVSGTVGIGTNSPAGPLQINSASAPPAGIPAGNNGLLLGSAGESSYKWIQSYKGSLCLNPLGNLVGIGTTAPKATLEISTDTGSGTLGDILRINSINGMAGNGGGILFANNKGAFNLARIAGIDAGNWGGSLAFYTSPGTGSSPGGTPTERMRIDSSGNIGIGTNAISNPLGWNRVLEILGTQNAGLNVRSSGGVVTSVCSNDGSAPAGIIGTLSNHPLWLGTNKNPQVLLDTAGNLTINGNLFVTGKAFKKDGGPWDSISDISLKKNIQPLKGSLDKLLQLRGVSFEWKEPEKQGNLTGTQMGMIAQDVEQVFPEWVGTGPDGTKYLSIRGFEALSVESFRELKAEIDALRQKVESVERQLGAVGGTPSAKECGPVTPELETAAALS